MRAIPPLSHPPPALLVELAQLGTRVRATETETVLPSFFSLNLAVIYTLTILKAQLVSTMSCFLSALSKKFIYWGRREDDAKSAVIVGLVASLRPIEHWTGGGGGGIVLKE